MKNRPFSPSRATISSRKTSAANRHKLGYAFDRIKRSVFVPSFLLLTISLLFFFQCNGTRPSTLGAQNGKLGLCPQTPNCVSSVVPETDSEHSIKPLSYKGTLEEGKTKLKTAIGEISRTQIVKEESDYLYVEFTSLIWRFVDDVEFVFDPNSPTIHVRSASRLGKSDLGVNRKRIETIREKLNSL
ncbi:DUF1499 domain-containing protein [Leptospira sp. 201903071]|nr:DUF1499 domain-containing protein [Leptospira ainazelensis]